MSFNQIGNQSDSDTLKCFIHMMQLMTGVIRTQYQIYNNEQLFI